MSSIFTLGAFTGGFSDVATFLIGWGSFFAATSVFSTTSFFSSDSFLLVSS